MLAESPRATLYTRGFSSFVTSTAAPIATGGADQFPGGTFPLWTSAFHGARKYLNNVVEQDHRVSKKRVWLARGYQSLTTAWRTIQGIEAVHMIRKGRAKWVGKGDPLAQLQFIEELFGLAI